MLKPKCVFRTERHGKEIFASVCMYCPDKSEGEQWAMEKGFVVSHGICAACLKIQFPDFPSEKITVQKNREGVFEHEQS